MFDVAICCYDGAEVCELVGLYILHKSHQHTQNEASVCTLETIARNLGQDGGCACALRP